MTPALRQYAVILRARWRWVAWGVVVAMAATAAVLILWPPRYRTEALIFVRTPGDISQVVDGGDSYAQSRAETYAALARSTAVSSRVIADTGLRLSPEKLASRVQARHIGGTALLQIRVSAPSPDDARRTADALITELTAEVRTLESVPGSVAPRAELVVVDAPERASRIVAWGAPLYPFLVGPVILGAFLGALGAVLSAMRSPQSAAVTRPLSQPSDSLPATAPEAL